MNSTPKQLPAPVQVPIADLFLDPQNPRIAALGLTVEDQGKIIGILWKEMAVNELVDSIATTGYWQHEEIFASKEHGKLIVIEGNRRVAAVKLLTDEALRAQVGVSGIPVLKKADQEIIDLTCSRL